jgi:hypothetical protein
MDIEGHETVLFQDPSWLSRVNVACIEWHDDSAAPQLSRVAREFGMCAPSVHNGLWVLSRHPLTQSDSK